MARLDRTIFRGTASGSDGPVKPGHDGKGPGHDGENSKPTHCRPGQAVSAREGPVPWSRRRLVVTAAGAVIAGVLPLSARATPAEVAALVRDFAGEATVRDAVLKLDLPVLVENGNAVALTVSALDPPSPIVEIQVYAEANPLPRVAVFRFGPRSGAARVSTRIRLATSQTVIALARSRDGSVWRDSVELLVTLAACIE